MATAITAAPAAKILFPSIGAIRELCGAEGPCASIYLGARRAGSGDGAPVVRLRALLRNLEHTAEDRAMSPVDAEAFFAPLHALEQDETLSAGHHEGFGIFRSPRVFQIFRVPGPPHEEASFGAFFDVLPMLRAIDAYPPFHLLTLSRKRARLFFSGPDGFTESPFPNGVISDFEEFKGSEHEQTWRNKSATGGGASLAFGAGDPREKEPRYFHDFCVALDRGLNSLPGSDALVLAATAHEQAAYREAAKSARLLPDPVLLSPDGGYTTAQLQEKARTLMAGLIPAAAVRALDQFAKAGPGRALSEENAVVIAAAKGRVAHLLVAEGVRLTGDYDSIAARTVWSGSLPARDENLAAAAAHDTLVHGGSVWVLPADRMPAGRSLAAVLRY